MREQAFANTRTELVVLRIEVSVKFNEPRHD